MKIALCLSLSGLIALIVAMRMSGLISALEEAAEVRRRCSDE